MRRLIPQLRKQVKDFTAAGPSSDGIKSFLNTPLYSNALYIMLANSTNYLFGVVFWIVAARFYSTDDIGLGSAVLSAAYLLAALSNLGFGYGLVRFLGTSKNPATLINSSFIIVGLVSLEVALVFILGIDLWGQAIIFIRDNPIYLVVFIFAVPASTLSGLADQAFVAGRRAGFIFARNLVFNLIRLVLIIALASFLHSFGIFASWGMAMFVSLLAGMLLFLPRSQPGYRPAVAFDRKSVDGMFRFSFANYVSDMFGSAPGFILPILVVNLLSAENNAYFYIAWMVGSMVTMIPGAVSTSLFAEGSHEEGGMEQHILRSVKMVLIILVPVIIFVLALADKLLCLFGSDYAQNATTLLRLLTVSAIPVAVNSLYYGIKRVERKLKAVIVLMALSGVLTIGLSYALMDRFGINGIGIAWLVSQSCVTLVIIIGWVSGRWRR